MKSRNVALIVGGVVALAFLGTIVIGMRSCSSAVSNASSVTGSKGSATLAKFGQVQAGMTYAEVVKIIGGEGAEMSRVEMPGMGEMVVYAWDGEGALGANMNATFQGGRLVSKAQAGLR